MTHTISHRLRRLGRATVCGLVRRFPGLKILLPTTIPLKVRRFTCGDERTSELIVFLPGIGDVLEDFELNEFVEAVRKSARPADMLVADVHAGYYFRRSMLERLHKDVIEPVKLCGYTKIWLVGISLGGFGALLYARDNASELYGLMLLAPYVGESDLIREISDAGGLQSWNPGIIKADDYAHRIWRWLKHEYVDRNTNSPIEIYLGFGDRDRFARANALLAEILPVERVVTLHGGHDWKTWREVWRSFLAHRDSQAMPNMSES